MAKIDTTSSCQNGNVGQAPGIAPHADPASGRSARVEDRLHIAVAAYLARYKDLTRKHAATDLGAFVSWCQTRGLQPLQAQRPHIELFVRRMQEEARYKLSTVSRRLSVVTGFYRTCVIDGLLEHSPADYVRRPHVPPESPTLGLSRLQFEAMPTGRAPTAHPAGGLDGRQPRAQLAQGADGQGQRRPRGLRHHPQLCGVTGSIGHSEVELLKKWARDSKIVDIFEGTQQIQQLIVTRRILGLSRAELT